MKDKEHIELLWSKIAAILPWTSSLWHQRFVLFSAHVGMAFPAIAPDRHLEWFHKVILNQQLMQSEEDGQGVEELDWEGPYDEMMDLLSSRPSIICTFHTGSYRMINHYLLKCCPIPHSILISEEAEKAESPNFRQKIQGMALPDEMELKTIVADQPYSALQIIRSLAAGRHVLAYLDGNLGSSTADTGRDPRVDMNFFGLPIHVRFGLAYLAHRAGVPLIGILAIRSPDLGNTFRIFHMISEPNLLHSDPHVFAGQVTKKMYLDLENLLKKEPWQWDMWFHLHEYFR